jgi:hypothetical protein
MFAVSSFLECHFSKIVCAFIEIVSTIKCVVFYNIVKRKLFHLK